MRKAEVALKEQGADGGCAAEVRAGQAVALRKGTAANGGDAVRHRDGGKTAESKGSLADAGDAVGNRDAGERAAVVKGVGGDLRQIPAQGHVLQRAAAPGPGRKSLRKGV